MRTFSFFETAEITGNTRRHSVCLTCSCADAARMGPQAARRRGLLRLPSRREGSVVEQNKTKTFTWDRPNGPKKHEGHSKCQPPVTELIWESHTL